MTGNDLDLLRDFARDQSQDAFTALVQRHLNLVYCAALRQVRSPQLAEEVAQSVFTDLARNAARLKPGTVLTAWLYQVTRRTAIDVVRREARRQLREQIASEMNTMNGTADDWMQIEPLLDEAMHALEDTDRTAVLLRYFENKSLREVGETLGTTDDAARKRISRAVDRLREFFAKRDVTVGTSGLVVVISANAVQAAPVGLAVTISTAAVVAGTTILTTATATVGKAIAMTALTKVLIAVTIVVIVGIGIYEARRVSKAQAKVEFPPRQSLAADAATLGRPATWQSEILKLKLRGGVTSDERLIIEFGPSGGQGNAPDAMAKLSVATVPKGPFQVNSSLGTANFRDVRLRETNGIRTITITRALEPKDRGDKKTQRIYERYYSVSFPYELKNNVLTLKGFPTTNAVTWGVSEFTVPQSEITFTIAP